jgi:GAF domain-containing protein
MSFAEIDAGADELDPPPLSATGELGFAGSASGPEQPLSGDATVESIVRLLTLVRADLAAALDEDAAPDELMNQVVRVATRIMPGADDAGIALATDRGLETVAAVGDIAIAVDDIQRALGRGPADAVISGGSPLRIADLAADERWREFGERAVDVGARALLSCPLPMPRKQPGVLSLYSGTPGAFDAAAELVVPVFAARAAIAAAYADKVTNLTRAVQSRQVIGQAVGILMERRRITAKQAFDVLVRTSQASHVKLRELAHRVSETGEDPERAAEG